MTAPRKLVEDLDALMAANTAEPSARREQAITDALWGAYPQLRAMARALDKIAAYEDSGASAWLAATGSYSKFDAPAAVEIARKALDAALSAGEKP